jgi:hypothetical protein
VPKGRLFWYAIMDIEMFNTGIAKLGAFKYAEA